MIQKFRKLKEKEKKRKKKKAEEEKRGRGKLTILLRSITRTLEVKVLHHVPEHLVIFFIDAIAP